MSEIFSLFAVILSLTLAFCFMWILEMLVEMQRKITNDVFEKQLRKRNAQLPYVTWSDTASHIVGAKPKKPS